jgi:hypothetical protein
VTKTDVLASTPLGDAVFELVREVVLPSGYGDTSGSASVRGRVDTGKGATPLDSLQALVQWATDQRLDLAAEASKAPAVFADFVAARELGVRVLSTPELYDFVEERFPVVLSQEGPRVEGGRLLFLAGRFGLNEEPGIWRVSVELANGIVERTQVDPRSAPTES